MSNILGNLPGVFAYLNTGVTSVTGNGTTYTIKCDTVLYGTDYNTTTGIYTVPLSGRYLIATCFQLNNIINSANGNLSSININAVVYRVTEFAMTAAKASGNLFSVNALQTFDLIAGDTVSVFAQLNNGTLASVGITGGTSPYMSWFYIKYLP